MNSRKNTKALRLKILQDRATHAQSELLPTPQQDGQIHSARQSFAHKLRRDVKDTRNAELRPATEINTPGYTESTEEVLRKHYFMAKATKKTEHSTLTKEMSPQKHLIKSEHRLKGEEQLGSVNKVRGETIDSL